MKEIRFKDLSNNMQTLVAVLCFLVIGITFYFGWFSYDIESIRELPHKYCHNETTFNNISLERICNNYYCGSYTLDMSLGNTLNFMCDESVQPAFYGTSIQDKEGKKIVSNQIDVRVYAKSEIPAMCYYSELKEVCEIK
jgi:hypothetical protein